MKKYLLLIFVMCVSYANAQKKNIDVDLLSNIISAKQDELKTRVLSNIVVKNIKTTNYTTYYTIYNLVDIITTEKNKTVMTQSLVRKIADYSLVMGLTHLYLKTHTLQGKKNQFFILKSKLTRLTDSLTRLADSLKGLSDSLIRLSDSLKGLSDLDKALSDLYKSLSHWLNDLIDSLKLNFAPSGFSKLMKSAYHYNYNSTKTELYESELDFKNKKNDTIIRNTLLSNFLIDTAYQVLSKNNTLTDRGFFKKDPQRQFFTSGLDIDYSGVRNHFNDYEGIVIEDFVIFLNACTTVTDSADGIAKFVQDKNIQFKYFGKDTTTKPKFKITKEQIGILMDLFNDAIGTFRDTIGQNNFIATIGDIISKHVIYDFSDFDQEKVYDFKIDVEAIILAFVDKFYANVSKIRYRIFGIKWLNYGFKPFFTIGLNYGYFVNQDNTFNFDNTSKNLTQIALAAEKLGVKFIFSDYKYKRSHPPMEWYKYKGKYRRWVNPVPKPLINNFYGMIYGSGLLYNIVDLKSEKNFKYGIIGTGLGIEFFNGLEFNLSYAMPIIPDVTIGRMLDNGFINLGFDIPIFEYLKAAKR